MPRFRKPLRAAALAAIPLLFLLFTAPALAAENAPAAPVKVSYFSRFFATESVLGTIVIWFLVLNSIALVALIIQAVIQFRRSVWIPLDLVDNVEAMIKEKRWREIHETLANDPSPLGQVLKHTLLQAGRGYDAMEQAVYEMADNLGNERIRTLVWMEVAGAAGPMMGLFGTVFGMIVAFTQMVALGGQPKPAELAGGIATALVCTFWGLVVGIPGVISAAVFRVRVESLTARTIWVALELIAPFRGGASLTPPAKTGASPPQPARPPSPPELSPA